MLQKIWSRGLLGVLIVVLAGVMVSWLALPVNSKADKAGPEFSPLIPTQDNSELSLTQLPEFSNGPVPSGLVPSPKHQGNEALGLGSVIATFAAPAALSGNGRGLAFDGTDLYYSIVGSARIAKVTTGGTLIKILGPGPWSRRIGALAFDPNTGHLWAATYEFSPAAQFFEINTSGTGSIVSSFTIPASGANDPFPNHIDGLAFDPSTNHLFYSTDLGFEVFEVTTAGVVVNSFTLPGGRSVSGMAFDGVNLWHAGCSFGGLCVNEIHQTDLSGTLLNNFSTAGFLAEDLAFDPVTFAPICVVWANQAAGRNSIRAFEVICPIINVAIDIKPQSCPNPLNTTKNGVLPVAVLGSAGFDISQIDPTTVELEGVPSEGRTLTPEDVATPFDGELCDCHDLAGDGFTDQVFMFDAQAIVAALGAVTNREERKLTLTGSLLDGSPFRGSDCVRIIIPKKRKLSSVVLDENYPNPFNPTTQISYSLPNDAYVQLDIFNIRGQKVKTLVDQRQTAGVHDIVWDGTDNTGRSVSSGIYFYRLQAADIVITKKMMLLK